MICFRDMTFCTFYEDCSRAMNCGRPLTPAVLEAARKWWGDNGEPPIAQFAERPRCHSEADPQ